MLPDGRAIAAIIIDSENTGMMMNVSDVNISNYTSGDITSGDITSGDISSDTSTDLGTELVRLFGIIMGLSAAFCAASSLIVIRKIKDRVDPLHVIFYFHWVLVPLALFLAPFIPSWMDSAVWIIPKRPETWALVLISTIFGTVGQIFLTRALQTEKAAKAASINNIQVVFAFTLEFIFWGAIPSALSVFGASIIIVSLVCATIYKNKYH